MPGSRPFLWFRRGLPGEANLARLGDARGLHRAKGDAFRSACGSVQEDPALSSGGSDSDPEPTYSGVPDGVLAGHGRELGDIGVGQTLPLRGHPLDPEDSADGIDSWSSATPRALDPHTPLLRLHRARRPELKAA